MYFPGKAYFYTGNMILVEKNMDVYSMVKSYLKIIDFNIIAVSTHVISKAVIYLLFWLMFVLR